MTPKKIYLNYVDESDPDKTWSEEPVSVCDCKMKNREYTDLSQVWHPIKKEPNIDEDVVLFDSCGNFVTEFYNGDVTWNNIVLFHKATMWAYIKDLLPKGGKKWHYKTTQPKKI